MHSTFPSIIRRLFITSRPRFWLYIGGPILLAIGTTPDPLVWLYALYMLTCGNLILYGINDICDQDTDAHNPKKSLKESRIETRMYERILTWSIVWSIGIGLIFIAYMPRLAQVTHILWVLLAIFYSTPPLRFKARPIIDSLSNILYIVPGITAYAYMYNNLPPIVILTAGALWSMAMHLYSAIPDQVADIKAGIQTSATFFGTKISLFVCCTLWLGSALYATSFSTWGAVLFVYPVLMIYIASQPALERIEQVYWWFPYLNTIVGGFLYIARISHML